MGLLDKIKLKKEAEKLDSIYLEDVLFLLDNSDDGNGLEILIELVKNGMPLEYARLGCDFDKLSGVKLMRDVAQVLSDIKQNGGDLVEAKIKIQEGRFSRHVGRMKIKRSDIRKVYLNYGEVQYPWPLTPKPKDKEDWTWFPVNGQCPSINLTETQGNGGVTSSSDQEPKSDVLLTQNLSEKTKQRQTRGPTKITVFLNELCQKQDIDELTAMSLVRAIKPYDTKINNPVQKYHGFYDDVCVEWKQGAGSTKRSWGKKSFQNFVAEFKTANAKKTVNKLF